jgi:hypothetical protein
VRAGTDFAVFSGLLSRAACVTFPTIPPSLTDTTIRSANSHDLRSRVARSGLEALGIAIGGLAVEQQGEPFGVRQTADLVLPLELDKACAMPSSLSALSRSSTSLELGRSVHAQAQSR